MPLEIHQYNTFDTFSLHYRKDRVYHAGREFPAGFFATEILNFAGEIHDPLLERITTLTTLVDDATTAEKEKSLELLAKLRPLMKDAVSWIYTCPPFCYQDSQHEWHSFELAMNIDRFEQDREDSPNHLPYYFLSFSEEVLKILVAIYNFCLLVRAFESKYLRRLTKRTESAFSKAAHECFDEDDGFLILLEQMPFGEIEEFFSKPRVISGFDYIQDPNDKEKWITVHQVVCKRLIDFYVFDLLNGLQCGHGPSWCRNCHRYFLTTTAHVPKYCDGIAPQDTRMTCRQYGAMMRQKEQNKNHPIYHTFTTRTSTIRKHHQRGKISDALRKEALYVAECLRDRALMDNDYAANGYAQDMEQERVYAEARKRLK